MKTLLKTLSSKILKSSSNTENRLFFDRIASLEMVGYDQVYDIEVANSHNFVAGGILAHNSYFGDAIQGAYNASTTLRAGGTGSGNGGTANIVFQSSGGAQRGRFDTATVTGSNSYGTFYVGAVNTTSADVAEYYDAIDSDLEPGAVVKFSPSLTTTGIAGLIKTTTSYDDGMAGVISSQPGLLLGGFDTEGPEVAPKKALMALMGRTPVKVSLENGPIEIGDKLTSASLPGFAMKAIKSGPVIGTALQSFGSATSSLEVGFSAESPSLATSTTGMIVAFIRVNAGVGLTASAGTISSEALTQDLDLGGNAIINVKSVAGLDNLWSIDEKGTIIAQSIETQSLTVGSASTTVSGITLYDRGDGSPKCLYIGEYNDLRVKDGACETITADGGLISNTNASQNNAPILSTTPDLNVTSANQEARSMNQEATINSNGQITVATSTPSIERNPIAIESATSTQSINETAPIIEQTPAIEPAVSTTTTEAAPAIDQTATTTLPI